MDLEAIRSAFRDPTDVHDPITSLVVLENTHADSMGQPLPADYIARAWPPSPTSGACRSTSTGRACSTPSWRSARRARELAGDGRLGHASACPRAWPARSARSSSGARDFIWRARRARKLLGGGMRQVGRPRRGRPDRAARRPGRHDRAPGRGPRQRAPAGRGAGRDARRRRPRSGAGAHQLRALPVVAPGSGPAARLRRSSCARASSRRLPARAC